MSHTPQATFHVLVSSRGLGHRPFTAGTRVRIPLPVPPSTLVSSKRDDPCRHPSVCSSMERAGVSYASDRGSIPLRRAKDQRLMRGRAVW